MDTGVRAGPCCSLSRTIPGTRRSWDPWQDLRPPRCGALHPPVTVSAGAERRHPGIEGLWWALGWGSGSVLAFGSLLGALATTVVMVGGTGVPSQWAAALKGSIRYIMWGCDPSGEVAHGLYVPLWCWDEALPMLKVPLGLPGWIQEDP